MPSGQVPTKTSTILRTSTSTKRVLEQATTGPWATSSEARLARKYWT
jgi:hypothetical protein